MADPNASLTPEQRLLQMIEDSGGGGTQTQTEKEAPKGKLPLGNQLVGAVKLSSPFSMETLKTQISAIKDQLVSFGKPSEAPLDFKQINRTATALTIGTVFFLAGALLYEFLSIGHKSGINLDILPKDVAELPVPENKIADLDLFKDPDRRNVFVPYVKKEEKIEEDVASQLSLRLAEIIKGFKLAGISINPMDSSRTFCMIEDIQKAMTSFLKVGDSISGLTITEIRPDSVVLEHEKEKIELR